MDERVQRKLPQFKRQLRKAVLKKLIEGNITWDASYC